MIGSRLLGCLRRDERGAMAIEFALIGPVFLLMFLGVLQVGIGLQNYNALRNVSADVARYAMVQHQTGNTVSSSQIRTYALNHGQGAPYLLLGERFDAVVNTAATQRVSGARELEITVTYQIRSLLDFAGIDGPFVSFTRPIFLLDNSTP